MDEITFKKRTYAFVPSTITFVEELRPGATGNVLGRQLLRSATSVGANYRSACRAKSLTDMGAKMAIVVEEVDECVYWFELLESSGASNPGRARLLRNEAEEILAISVSSVRTLQQRARAKPNNVRESDRHHGVVRLQLERSKIKNQESKILCEN